MNATLNLQLSRTLDAMLAKLDIPRSHYERAVERYQALGDWFHRPESSVAHLEPQVCPQGSFSYGTVVRPLGGEDEYDLDLVCRVEMSKEHLTQAQLKELFGREIAEYATRYRFNEPPREKNRCWRLEYADGVSFHMDILPCAPEDASIIAELARLGVRPEFAEHAVALTDRRLPNYRVLSRQWPTSNPSGLRQWFAERADASRPVFARTQKSIADVPAYEWKTPLQQSIQILKRHRDQMFRESRDLQPISMIITTLAALAFRPGVALADGLVELAENMSHYVAASYPRVANPVNPIEDFADAWKHDARLEINFRSWLAQLHADLTALSRLSDAEETNSHVKRAFGLHVSRDELNPGGFSPSTRTSQPAPAVHIHQPVNPPWGSVG